MKNPNIARMLRYYRQLNEFSIQDVSELLGQCGHPAATKTIYGWENGQTQPDADTFMLLCELYQVEDVLLAFGYRRKSLLDEFKVNYEERELVFQYRKNKEMQNAVKKLLDVTSFY